MPEQLDDPVLLAFAGSMLLLSAATVFCLLVARSRGPLLKFQPRALVPWNAAGAALACVLVTLILFTALQTEPAPVETSDAVAPNIALTLSAWVVQELFLVGGFLFLIAVYFKATCIDLGLPSNLRELVRDAGIGVVAGVAALAPVLLIQAQLIHWLHLPEMESGNPFIKKLMGGGPDVGVMLLATFATVVVAPVCEEITFRLLLQGWLEKWEAKKLGLGVASLDSSVSNTQLVSDETLSSTNSQFHTLHSTLDSPPSLGLASLPFSWLPITISSLLFALAHFGYGPEPVPLFLLALVLGYLYYRTHRIVPSIVAHAVFNAFTMAMLWRMAFHGVP